MDTRSATLGQASRTRLGRGRQAPGSGATLRPVPLDDAQKVQVFRLSREGIGIEAIAGQFGVSRKAVARVVNEVRALRLLESKLEFMSHPSFEDPAQHREILGPMPEVPAGFAHRRPERPEGLPPYLADLYEAPLLSRDQERHLFRKMNFLKYQAAQIRSRLDPATASTADMDKIEQLQGEALAVKNQLIRSNLRLVVSISKKHIGPRNNFFELVSDGNISLIRAVEKFDFSLGNKFSTYASWALIRNFSRTIPEEDVRRDRFQTGHGELFEAEGDHRTDERESETGWRQSRELLKGILDRLDERERRIVVSRYGLDGVPEQTLEQIGRDLGVTKERIRQLEMRAFGKLRKFASDQQLEISAL